MDLVEIIRKRRSIRRFTSKDVPADILEQVLQAIQWTPSWSNHQIWEIVLVRDLSRKIRIQECVGKDNPAFKGIVEAPILLVFCAKLHMSGYYKGESTKFGEWFMYDLGLATQSTCLTAHAHGLGTVIVGSFDHDKVGEILRVPEGYEAVTIVPLGYPAHSPKAPGRKNISEFTHKEYF